jgi:hypothetical protein
MGCASQCSCCRKSCPQAANLEFKVPKENFSKSPLPRSFILRRNIYRNFSNFYKDLFAKYTKKFMNLRTDLETKDDKMKQFLYEFIEENYEIHYSEMDDEHKQQFMLALKQVLFSHRHKKDDIFVQRIDFKPVRDVMYSYSYKAREQFFSCIHR